MGRSLLVTVVLGAVVLSTPAARAEEEVIALPARVPDGFTKRLSTRLSRETSARLSKAGLRVRTGADITIAVRGAADCPDATCLKDRLGATGARLAARIVLERSAEGWSAKLEVTTLRMGQVLVSEEADCAGCDERAVVELALSLIDGVQIPEHDPEPEPVAPPPAEPAPPPPPPPEPPPPPAAHGGSGIPSLLTWTSAIGGIVLIAASVPLWLNDGEPTCDGPTETCPHVYDFFLSAGIMTGVGVIALVTAGALLVLSIDDDEDEEPSTARGPHLRLGLGGLSGTF